MHNVHEPARLDLRGRLKFLLTDSVIYGGAMAISKVLSLITFPLLARHFAVGDYGLIDLLTSTILLFSTILTFGIDSAMARYFYEGEDPGYRRQVVSQALAFLLLVLVAVVPVLWIVSPWLAELLSVGPSGRTALAIIILQAPFFVVTNLASAVLKWTFRRWEFLTVSVGGILLSTIILVVSVLWFRLDVADVFLIYLGVRVTCCAVSLLFIRQWIVLPTDWQVLRRMLPFATPFGVICVVSAFVPVWERSIVQSILGPVELGLLAAGAKIALLIALPIAAFETSWGPFSLALFKQADAQATFRVVLKGLAILLVTTTLALTAIAELLVQLLGSDRYAGASIVVFPMAAALAIQSLGSVASVGITFSKKSYLFLYGYAGMVVVALVAAPALALRFGLAGAAWGSLLGYLGKAIVDTVLAQRTHPMRWDFRRPVLISVACLALGALHQATFGQYRIGRLDLLPLLGMGAILLLGWYAVLGQSEREWITLRLRRRLWV